MDYSDGRSYKKTQLIQAKVDKELFDKFRVVKNWCDRSYRSMFEYFMKEEINKVEQLDTIRSRWNV